MRRQLARLLDLAGQEAVALAPVALLWWFAYLDEEDRGAILERARELFRVATFADFRDYASGPRLAFAKWRRAGMIAEEWDEACYSEPEQEEAPA
jgi:hypothetical protein